MIESVTCLSALVKLFTFELDGPAPVEEYNFSVAPSAFRVKVLSRS